MLQFPADDWQNERSRDPGAARDWRFSCHVTSNKSYHVALKDVKKETTKEFIFFK